MNTRTLTATAMLVSGIVGAPSWLAIALGPQTAHAHPHTEGDADDEDVPAAIPEPDGEAQLREPQVEAPRWLEGPAPGPSGAFPPAPPRGLPRQMNFALSMGPGFLMLSDAIGRDGQRALGLSARVGAVVAPHWNLHIGVDHTSTDRKGATFSQTALLVGAQRFVLGRVYLGGAVGLARVAQSGVPDGIADGPGLTLSAHVGVEALRWSHVALTAEIGFTRASYEREAWEMGGLRIGAIAF